MQSFGVNELLQTLIGDSTKSSSMLNICDFLTNGKVNIQPLYDLTIRKKKPNSSDFLISSILFYLGLKAKGIKHLNVIFKDGNDVQIKTAEEISQNIRIWAFMGTCFVFRWDYKDTRLHEHFDLKIEAIKELFYYAEVLQVGTSLDKEPMKVTNMDAVLEDYLSKYNIH